MIDRLLASEPVEEESGDLKNKEDQEHRLVSERDKLRVIWNMERRCYVDSNGVKRYQFQLRCNLVLDVQLNN